MVKHKLPICGCEIYLHSSQVRKWVTHAAAEMHNTLERQECIQGEMIYSWALLGVFPDLETTMPFHSEEDALHIRGRRILTHGREAQTIVSVRE
jgi:hypothetical protein